MRRLALVLLAACGGGDGGSSKVVASTSFFINDSSGQGPSHLDVLAQQMVAMEVVFDSPFVGHALVGGCPTTGLGQEAAITTATGATAAMVKTEILDYLPDWDLRLSLCDVVSQSAIELAADNQMNTGFTVGCIGLPASAIVKDGEGNPKFTSFTAPSCTFTILDADTNRVLAASNFTMTISAQ